MNAFEKSEKSIFAGNAPLYNEHLVIVNAFFRSRRCSFKRDFTVTHHFFKEDLECRRKKRKRKINIYTKEDGITKKCLTEIIIHPGVRLWFDDHSSDDVGGFF
jgi:hypothetical protein